MTSAETERLLDGPANEADERGSSEHNSRRANYGQLIMVLMVLLCEPIVAFMPMPFLAQLVNETGITKGDESQTGYYVGLIESCFFLTQGLCILHWGSLSDRIGRRPVLLIGLLGLTLSMLSFGLSQSFTAVVLSRIIAGVLNGNVGVAKTMIVELTDESNRAWSMTLLPITWITGATLTPIVGGALQHPAERFEMFKDNAFLKQNPYFLPCFVAVAACGFTWIATFFFLRETLTTAKDKKKTKSYGSTGTPSESESEETAPPAVKAGSIKAVITRPVLIAIMNYGWLALLEISYWAILTVFLPVPVSAGGLNLPPPTVGIIFGTLGLFDGLLQLIAFPSTYKRFGPKKIMIATFVSFWAIYACFPVMHELAKAHPTEPGSLHPGVWVAMGALVLFAGMIDMGYSVNFMFVSAAAPDPTLLGTTNGLAQMVISFTRALGPVGATSLFSISTTHPKWLGLHGYGVFVFLALLTGVAVYCSTLLPEEAKVDKDD